MNTHPLRDRLHRAAWRVGAAVCAAAFVGLSADAARADNVPSCTSSASNAYSMTMSALTGPAGANLALAVTPSPGCGAVHSLKKVELHLVAPDGSKDTRKFTDEAAPGGVVDLALGQVARGTAISANVLVQTGTPERTYVLRGDATAKLRPDLVVGQVTPQQALVNKPVVVTAVIRERNGDVGANAVVSMSAIPGSSEPVTVPAGGQATVKFAAATFANAVPVELTVKVDGATPAETDTSNNTAVATLDVTEHQLPTPRTVLFPSLGGYGAQFNMHLYAPVTPWPVGQGYGDVEEKITTLQPHIVRIFYNDRWDANVTNEFPNWRENYASFVKVAKLAEESGATILVSFQNLSVARLPGRLEPSMELFAGVLEDLVKNHGLKNVRWAEVGNEPNAGAVTLEQMNEMYRSLHAKLVARGLHGQVKLMGVGLVENANNPTRNHYEWQKWIAENMGDILDAYAEHVYWIYDDSGRLEYRLRDSWNLMNKVLPAEQRKPVYMMEFGIRGYNSCAGKPTLFAQNQLYYRPGDCADIWRLNIAGFQQLWFNIASAQLGVAGTAKWDAYWGRYDNSSINNQLYWMVGPPTEGSPLTPTYNAMRLLFHTTVPGWQIIGVEPWEENDWAVPAHGVEGHRSSDTPEKELAAYAGPAGELTILGLDTNGRDLNTASTGAPAAYSIGGLPPSTSFRLALWNATGDGANSLAGPVTTNAAGVARFEVPLHAAFALTTVPVT